MIWTRLKATLGKLLYPLFPGCIQNNSSRFEEVQEEESSKAQKRARESDVADTSTKSGKKSKKIKAADGKPVVVETDAVKEGEKKVEAEQAKDGQKEKKNKKEKKKVDTPGEKSTPAKKTIAGGIVTEDAVVGTGPMAKKGNTVRVRYVGKLTNGKEFDKNTSGKPVCGCVRVSVTTSDPFPVRFPSRKGRSHQRYNQVTAIYYSLLT
jgi:FKBP-type peptidyl-prolyl cis-trans isomerase